MKKLRRSQSDRMLAGVCGGLGEYFDIDPTLVRLGAVGLTLFARLGIPVLYLVMALVMPLEGEAEMVMIEKPGDEDADADMEAEADPETESEA